MIKLYLDEDVHEDIAMALRLRGYDIKTTREVGNKGLSDIEQLRYATKKDRVIISFNIADFNKLHSEFIKKGIEHSGIILSKQLPIGIIVKALLKLLSKIGSERMKNNIIWLSDWVK
jgi:predicted nuclease of predicted toxin-antitoxin system